jgi:hypothetical protein
MNKIFLESKMKMLLKYGQATLKGIKAYHEFAAHCEKEGYELEKLASLDGCSVTVRLVVHE